MHTQTELIGMILACVGLLTLHELDMRVNTIGDEHCQLVSDGPDLNGLP